MRRWGVLVVLGVAAGLALGVACDEASVGNECHCTYSDGVGGVVDYEQVLCDDVEASDAEQIVGDECYEAAGVPCDCMCDPAAAGSC